MPWWGIVLLAPFALTAATALLVVLVGFWVDLIEAFFGL